MTNSYDQNNTLENAPSQNVDAPWVNLKSKEPPVGNVYEQYFVNQERNIDNQVRRSLQQVMERDPEKTGEALRLQEELGLDRNIALDSEEAIKLMRERNRIKRLESLELAKYSPILYRQLTDPTFAALAKDNLEELQGLERIFFDLGNSFGGIPGNAMQGWEKGRLQTRRGHIGVQQWWGDTNQELEEELQEIDDRLYELEADGTGIVEEGFAILGQYSQTLPKAFLAGGAGAGVGAVATSWSGPGAAVGAKTGFVWGFMTSLAYDSLAIEGGNMFIELDAAKFDKTHSRWISLGTGLASAALELWGFSILSAPLKKLLVKQTTKHLVRELAKPTGQAALLTFLKNYAGGNLAESGTEAAQQLTQIIGREIAVLFDDREDVESRFTSWEGVGGVALELADVFIRSLQGMV